MPGGSCAGVEPAIGFATNPESQHVLRVGRSIFTHLGNDALNAVEVLTCTVYNVAPAAGCHVKHGDVVSKTPFGGLVPTATPMAEASIDNKHSNTTAMEFRAMTDSVSCLAMDLDLNASILSNCNNNPVEQPRLKNPCKKLGMSER